MSALVCLLFFFSGVSALLYEMLWFRLCGLAFGNSVWAAAIVAGSFMAGLALGNGYAAFKGKTIKSPMLFYAALEITIGVSGLCIVLLLPFLTVALAPLLKAVIAQPLLLHFLRACSAFAIMSVPTTAMGATLPVLVKALYRADPDFGAVLGKLYGWNTLGAMAGVVAADALLVRIFGVRGTGFIAFGINCAAAVMALYIYKSDRRSKTAPPETPHGVWRVTPRTGRLLAASLISGFAVLALEVVWFRFIILFFTPHVWNFAVMLAFVLAGISIGGLLASQWARRVPRADRSAIPLFLLNGAAIGFLYWNFGHIVSLVRYYPHNAGIVLASLFLILPVCLISGVLFTMIGKSLHGEIRIETASAGLLTLSNTLGGLAGSIAAAFWFIPLFGIEKSFFIIALLYGLGGGVLFGREHRPLFKQGPGFYLRAAGGIALAAYVSSLVLFPFGLMDRKYLDLSLGQYASMGLKRVAAKEGLTETVQCLEKDILDKPHYHFLVTNNHSMSSTFLKGKRYMKLYVYLPAALHPGLTRALLIGYGCGSTAKALTDTKSLKAIDIADISRDIVGMSHVIYPDPSQNPVNDPRVSVHIEDGRFFLLTTDKKYDLITAEPPPPKNNGIVNLYTQEYFQLIYNRLADGGFVTYWLPVYQFSLAETRAVVKAFANVFKDYSLWTGAEYEWMLVGVKNPGPRVSTEAFSRQWQDPSTASEMRALGFISPEQLGSLFLADGGQLSQWIFGAPPLTDNFPHRLSYDLPDDKKCLSWYSAFMDQKTSMSNFVNSRNMQKMWPESMIAASKKYFEVRQIINELLTNDRRKTIAPGALLKQAACHPLLKNGDYLLWALQSDAFAQDIVGGKIKEVQKMIQEGDMQNLAPVSGHLAALAAQQGDYGTAEKYVHLAANSFGPRYLWNSATQIRTCLLNLAGENGKTDNRNSSRDPQ
jgi:spermidine synthase